MLACFLLTKVKYEKELNQIYLNLQVRDSASSKNAVAKDNIKNSIIFYTEKNEMLNAELLAIDCKHEAEKNNKNTSNKEELSLIIKKVEEACNKIDELTKKVASLESKNVSLSEKVTQQEKSNLEQMKSLTADHDAKTKYLNNKINELCSDNKCLLVKQKEQEEAARRSRDVVKKLSAELTQVKKENIKLETKQAAVCKELDENNKKIEDMTCKNVNMK